MNSEIALRNAKMEHLSRNVKKITAWRFRVAGVRLLFFVYSARSKEPDLPNRRSTHYRWDLYIGDSAKSGGIIKTEWEDC